MRWLFLEGSEKGPDLTRAPAMARVVPAGAGRLRTWAIIALAFALPGMASLSTRDAWAQEPALVQQAAPPPTLVQQAAPPPALVQQAAPTPAIDAGQLQKLVTTLEDPAAREQFVAQLKALIGSSKASEPAGQAELETLGINLVAEFGARMNALPIRSPRRARDGRRAGHVAMAGRAGGGGHA